MPRANEEVALALRELAALTKLDEGSPQAFRVRAYEKAVDAVRALPGDVTGMSVKDLKAVDGIGESTARKIREYLDTGKISKLEELRAKYPPELGELMKIPGLGPKTIIQLRDQLGVQTLEDLRTAVADERLRELPGLGEKSEEKIGHAIDRLGLHSDERRTPIIEALPIAAQLTASLRSLPGIDRAEYCGSLRRFRETIGDVDVLVAAADAEPVMDAFASHGLAREVLARGDTKAAILTPGDLQVDLRVVEPHQFGAALLYFTGSKAHNIALRQRAIDRGWLLNEYGLSEKDTEAVVADRTEEDIYEALQLRYIAPPLREDLGEIEAAASGELPDLVEVADIRGDLHVHSTWSGDGRSDLEDMVAAAAQRGLSYIAITEHGEDLPVNGLSRQEVQAEAEALEALGEKFPRLHILHGAELNIGREGSLDYDDDFLMTFDWCVASVHSHFEQDAGAQTARILAAMEHPAVNAIGHLTGRRIGKRLGIELDVDAVFGGAIETGTALEINCHLDRLDVPSDLLRRARDVDELVFVISTDSHHVTEFDHIQWGVLNAQRGWVDKRRVVNSWPWSKFSKWATKKR